MTSPTNTAEQAVALGQGEGRAVWFLRSRITIKATAETTAGAYGLFESWIAQGFSPPLHVHHREDEAFWVLDGDLSLRCGNRTFHAGPGAFVFLPRDVPHTFVVEGDRPARMLTLLTPGGGEGLFIEGGRSAENDGLPPERPMDVEALEALKRVSERFASEIVGPPMAPARR